jgi:hypothetical protein
MTMTERHEETPMNSFSRPITDRRAAGATADRATTRGDF